MEEANEMHEWLEFVTGSAWLGTALTAAICIIVTVLIAELVARFLKNLLSRDDAPLPSSSIFVNLARALIYAAGASVILSSCFGVDVNAIVTALGVGGIALSLGLKDTISNLVGGLQIAVIGLISPGDRVSVGGVEGVVRDTTWRHTTIVTDAGDEVCIPNASINTGSLTHLSKRKPESIDVSIVCDGAAIEERCLQVKEAAMEAASALGPMDGEPEFCLSEVTADGFKGTLTYTNTTGRPSAEVKDAVIRAIAPHTR